MGSPANSSCRYPVTWNNESELFPIGPFFFLTQYEAPMGRLF